MRARVFVPPAMLWAIVIAAAPLAIAEPVSPKQVVAAGRAPVRRLNRREYENTLRDLLDLPGLAIRDMLPEDGRAHGFDKSAAGLDVSPVHIAAYRSAA